MEARIRRETRQFYDTGALELNTLGTKRVEWDLNDWQWDGNLFVATPLNAIQSCCRNKQIASILPTCSDEAELGVSSKEKGESDKKRRIVVVEDDEPSDNGEGSLALNLGGNAYPVAEADLANWEGKSGKRSKFQGGSSNRSISCQVEGCGTDLSDAKDYHRRHKVCELHAKASTAVVNNVLQRFCQQCSRFHLLEEFDEGKRSCRRRLAGHNRRRRKTHPDATSNGNPLIDDRASSYLLISLLRILSNLHSNNSDQSKDQDLLSHLLRNLATLAGSFDAGNLSGLLQASQDSQRLGTSAGMSPEATNGLPSNCVPGEESTRPLTSTSKVTCTTSTQGPSPEQVDHSVSTAAASLDLPLKRSAKEAYLKSTVERVGLKDFDLNSTYSGTENCEEMNGNMATPASLGTGSPISPSWLLQDAQQSSPPQISGNSDSTSAQSLTSSNGDAQGRTDRIVFKLFGKDPNDFPLVLRSQILNWLSHSPTEIESYIRPGCIILTVYLHLAESAWEELCSDLSSSLNRLVYNSGDDFWRTGWLYARIQHHISFICNGRVLLNTPRLLGSPCHCKILSVAPVAAAISATVNFTVKGLNLIQPTSRLLCAFDGKYLVQETRLALVEGGREHEVSQCLGFSCSLPNAMGRGFIEVEDHGLTGCFFPFIVAEDDVCSEIRMLENAIDIAPYDDKFQEVTNVTKQQALDFLNEMGWLLRRSHLRITSRKVIPSGFSLTRFRWLMGFAMERAWCAVVKKLLDILFEGTVDLGGCSPVELAASEGLLHSAVRKNSKSMVEVLLRYKPNTAAKDCDKFFFRPDMLGPCNITPLHVAATMNATECVLDALTDDPGQLGIKAWTTARDSTGFTPEDYARSRGQESYLKLVQKKLDEKLDKGHVALAIPSSLLMPAATCKESYKPKSGKQTGFEFDDSKFRPTRPPYCNLCSQQLARRTPVGRSLLYRPAMLSMVGIAAVCVCVGLLFKGPPEVTFVFPPFRWEDLAYGSI